MKKLVKLFSVLFILSLMTICEFTDLYAGGEGGTAGSGSAVSASGGSGETGRVIGFGLRVTLVDNAKFFSRQKKNGKAARGDVYGGEAGVKYYKEMYKHKGFIIRLGEKKGGTTTGHEGEWKNAKLVKAATNGSADVNVIEDSLEVASDGDIRNFFINKDLCSNSTIAGKLQDKIADILTNNKDYIEDSPTGKKSLNDLNYKVLRPELVNDLNSIVGNGSAYNTSDDFEKLTGMNTKKKKQKWRNNTWYKKDGLDQAIRVYKKLDLAGFDAIWNNYEELNKGSIDYTLGCKNADGSDVYPAIGQHKYYTLFMAMRCNNGGERPDKNKKDAAIYSTYRFCIEPVVLVENKKSTTKVDGATVKNFIISYTTAAICRSRALKFFDLDMKGKTDKSVNLWSISDTNNNIFKKLQGIHNRIKTDDLHNFELHGKYLYSGTYITSNAEKCGDFKGSPIRGITGADACILPREVTSSYIPSVKQTRKISKNADDINEVKGGGTMSPGVSSLLCSYGYAFINKTSADSVDQLDNNVASISVKSRFNILNAFTTSSNTALSNSGNKYGGYILFGGCESPVPEGDIPETKHDKKCATNVAIKLNTYNGNVSGVDISTVSSGGVYEKGVDKSKDKGLDTDFKYKYALSGTAGSDTFSLFCNETDPTNNVNKTFSPEPTDMLGMLSNDESKEMYAIQTWHQTESGNPGNDRSNWISHHKSPYADLISSSPYDSPDNFMSVLQNNNTEMISYWAGTTKKGNGNTAGLNVKAISNNIKAFLKSDNISVVQKPTKLESLYGRDKSVSALLTNVAGNIYAPSIVKTNGNIKTEFNLKKASDLDNFAAELAYNANLVKATAKSTNSIVDTSNDVRYYGTSPIKTGDHNNCIKATTMLFGYANQKSRVKNVSTIADNSSSDDDKYNEEHTISTVSVGGNEGGKKRRIGLSYEIMCDEPKVTSYYTSARVVWGENLEVPPKFYDSLDNTTGRPKNPRRNPYSGTYAREKYDTPEFTDNKECRYYKSDEYGISGIMNMPMFMLNDDPDKELVTSCYYAVVANSNEVDSNLNEAKVFNDDAKYNNVWADYRWKRWVKSLNGPPTQAAYVKQLQEVLSNNTSQPCTILAQGQLNNMGLLGLGSLKSKNDNKFSGLSIYVLKICIPKTVRVTSVLNLQDYQLNHWYANTFYTENKYGIAEVNRPKFEKDTVDYNIKKENENQATISGKEETIKEYAAKNRAYLLINPDSVTKKNWNGGAPVEKARVKAAVKSSQVYKIPGSNRATGWDDPTVNDNTNIHADTYMTYQKEVKEEQHGNIATFTVPSLGGNNWFVFQSHFSGFNGEEDVDGATLKTSSLDNMYYSKRFTMGYQDLERVDGANANTLLPFTGTDIFHTFPGKTVNKHYSHYNDESNSSVRARYDSGSFKSERIAIYNGDGIDETKDEHKDHALFNAYNLNRASFGDERVISELSHKLTQCSIYSDYDVDDTYERELSSQILKYTPNLGSSATNKASMHKYFGNQPTGFFGEHFKYGYKYNSYKEDDDSIIGLYGIYLGNKYGCNDGYSVENITSDDEYDYVGNLVGDNSVTVTGKAPKGTIKDYSRDGAANDDNIDSTESAILRNSLSFINYAISDTINYSTQWKDSSATCNKSKAKNYDDSHRTNPNSIQTLTKQQIVNCSSGGVNHKHPITCYYGSRVRGGGAQRCLDLYLSTFTSKPTSGGVSGTKAGSSGPFQIYGIHNQLFEKVYKYRTSKELTGENMHRTRPVLEINGQGYNHILLNEDNTVNLKGGVFGHNGAIEGVVPSSQLGLNSSDASVTESKYTFNGDTNTILGSADSNKNVYKIAVIDCDSGVEENEAGVQTRDGILKFRPEVAMQIAIPKYNYEDDESKDNTNIYNSCYGGSYFCEIMTMGEMLRQTKISSMYILKLKKDAGNIEGKVYSDTMGSDSNSSAYQNASTGNKPVIYGGSDVTLDVTNTNLKLSAVCYALDMINKDIDGRDREGGSLNSNMLYPESGYASAAGGFNRNKDAYSDIIANSFINPIKKWGNFVYFDIIKTNFSNWVNEVNSSLKASVVLGVYEGSGSTAKNMYNTFNVSTPKYTMHVADKSQAYSIRIKNGKFLVSKELYQTIRNSYGYSAENQVYLDIINPVSKWKGNTCQVMDDLINQIYSDYGCANYMDAWKLFINSDIATSILRSIESSTIYGRIAYANKNELARNDYITVANGNGTSNYYKNKSIDALDDNSGGIFKGAGVTKRDKIGEEGSASSSARTFYGVSRATETHWYDEQVKTFVIRRFTTNEVSIKDIVLNDKLDYDTVAKDNNQSGINGNINNNYGSNGTSNTTRTGKWFLNLYFDKEIPLLENKVYNENTDGVLTGTKLANNEAAKTGGILINNIYITGADFLIPNETTDALVR